MIPWNENNNIVSVLEPAYDTEMTLFMLMEQYFSFNSVFFVLNNDKSVYNIGTILLNAL
jgi:hypothetical protein